MGHRPPVTGFTWPVPPEDIAGVPVLILEWSPEGRVTVRQEALDVPETGQPQSPADVLRPLASDPGPIAPAAFEPTWPAADRTPAPGSHIRERATWLGIGTVVGMALTASMMPDASTVSGVRADASTAPVARASVASLIPAGAQGGGPASAVPSLSARPLSLAVSDATTSAPVSDAGARRSSARQAATPVSVSFRPKPPAAAVPAVRREARTPRPDTTDVLREVHRYEAALSRMDAAATQAAWPGADHGALVRQFTNLREQRLRLERCTVDAPGDRAAVTCRGTLSYRPRVGDHSTRTTRGTWRFVLERDGPRWVIDDVVAPVVKAAP